MVWFSALTFSSLLTYVLLVSAADLYKILDGPHWLVTRRP